MTCIFLSVMGQPADMTEPIRWAFVLNEGTPNLAHGPARSTGHMTWQTPRLDTPYFVTAAETAVSAMSLVMMAFHLVGSRGGVGLDRRSNANGPGSERLAAGPVAKPTPWHPEARFIVYPPHSHHGGTASKSVTSTKWLTLRSGLQSRNN